MNARNKVPQRPKRTRMRLLLVLLVFLLVILLARNPCDPPGDPAPACKPGELCPVDAPAPVEGPAG